ncbi:MAG: CIA30 family protein [Fibrobacter sp.]|nr:CIA30 family protein [Fibrobacter sp.]
MKKKTLFAITAAASFALLASACSSDEKNPQTPGSNDNENPPVTCDTCIVPEDKDSIPTICDTCQTPTPVNLKGIMIDDFEDGDGSTAQGNGWFTYDDQTNGGASVVTTPVNEDGYPTAFAEGYESSYGFKLEYTLDKGDYAYDPYVALGVAISPEDFSAIGGIHYCYKGGAHSVRVETSDVTDYDVHGTKMLASTGAWKCVDVKFRDLAQEGWGKHVEFDSENINQISFHIKGSAKVTTGSLMIDNVWFLHNDELPPEVADLEKKEAVIPEVTIGEIAISNPLQAKAMKYLNQGVNFTNWLENADGKFSGKFEFGEKDIKLLSDYGFKSLRLPIDLDLYVTNRKAFLADTTGATALEFDDEALFTVLDSFAVWTEKYNMSFVIDYHEYDNSYNVTTSKDSVYINMMAGVWKHVAAHYASSDREDLFFELLNEPDMTNGKVTAANWTIAAQAMIDAIRSVDTKHTLIFGDAQWYSITLLAKRTPFTDDNIVYAIHTYEPFLFTHQGGSWTDYAAIHDIPFPYVAEDWSEFSSTYGVNAGVLSSVKSAIKTYYKNGSKEAILQNVLKAKEWAVTNNVPVIINEFGALRDKSDAKSVLNYYKAMIDICDTLQIPWTHWGYTGGFSVVDDQGKLYEGLADVMRLTVKE